MSDSRHRTIDAIIFLFEAHIHRFIFNYIFIVSYFSVFAFGETYAVLFVARAFQGIGSACSSVAGKSPDVRTLLETIKLTDMQADSLLAICWERAALLAFRLCPVICWTNKVRDQIFIVRLCPVIYWTNKVRDQIFIVRLCPVVYWTNKDREQIFIVRFLERCNV